MRKNIFDERMRLYENFERKRILMPKLPVIVRLDGKCFHTFCKGLKKPFDERLSNLMIEVTKILIEETNANMGYTQSDEITLTWYNNNYFNGRIFKINTRLAALASVSFNSLLPDFIPEKNNKPTFDCCVFNVPNLEEGVNQFLWRERDATRNSISMAAQSMFSHNELHNKNSNDMQDMMMTRNINWNNYPTFFKRGTYIQRILQKTKFSEKEIEKLPEKHLARTNPDLIIERFIIEKIDLPILSQIDNKIDVIYYGKKPIIKN